MINGRYEVRGVLGVGGTAIVYDGFDGVIHRPVAIKVVRRGRLRHGDIEKVKATRVQQEARAAARIEHPNVVTIYDMGMVHPSGEPFIVMERLVGHDLHQELERRGPMTAQRAFWLFGRCLDALAVGHREGLVHRDLKPGNIFLLHPGSPQEDVRVLDFGTASWAGWEDRISRMGRILGTIGYLAPEYLAEQTVLPALDVYQMGLVLAEMFMGHPVFEGLTPADCVRAHLDGAIYLPESLLVSPLGVVLPIALARDPALRFRDAAVFAEALALVDVNAVPVPSPNERRLRITPEATLAALHRYEAGQVSVWTPPPSEELAVPTSLDLGVALPSWLEDLDEAALEPSATLPPGILAPATHAAPHDFDPPTLLASRGRHNQIAPTIADESLSGLPDFAQDSFFSASAPGAEIDRALALVGADGESAPLAPEKDDTVVESTVVDSGPSRVVRAAGREAADTIPASDLFVDPEPPLTFAVAAPSDPSRPARRHGARRVEPDAVSASERTAGPSAAGPPAPVLVAEPPVPDPEPSPPGPRPPMETARIPARLPESVPESTRPATAELHVAPPAAASPPGLLERLQLFAAERDIELGSVFFFGVGGVVTVAVVVWLVFLRGPAPLPSTQPAADAGVTAAQPPEAPPDPVDPTAHHDPPEADESEPAPPSRAPLAAGEQAIVTVRSTPPTSWVYLKGKQVGRTPWPITFDGPDAAEVNLMLRHVGYKDRYIKVGPGNRPGVRIKMRKR